MEEKTPLEEKMAAELELRKTTRRAALIAQLIAAWQADHIDQQITREKEEELARQADAQITREAQANAEPAPPLSDSPSIFKEAMSKVGNVFKGSRFEFIGTALEAFAGFFIKLMPVFQSIIPMIQNLGSMFNRPAAGSAGSSDETSMDDINNLLEKGKLNAANELLKEKELQLLDDMDEALESDKDAKAIQEHEGELTGCRQALKTLEDNLEALTPLKQRGADKGALKTHLEKIERDLKQITERYEILQPRVEAAADSLQSLPIIFERMKPILEAHQRLYDKEVEEVQRVVAPH